VLGERLLRLVASRHEHGDHTLRDEQLGAALRARGDAAETRGASSDAYLASVWATQADPDLVRFLYRDIAKRRAGTSRVPFLVERALLGRFYASGDPYWQLALSYFYESRKLADKARFFRSRLSPADAARTVVATPVPGLDSDFEGTAASGWTVHGTGFKVVPGGGDTWGFDGRACFASDSGRQNNSADAESAPFTVAGRALSFLLAGRGGDEVAVNLRVDGKVREHTAVPESRFYESVFWDLAPYAGKTATLELIDHSRTGHGFLAVDAFRIWSRPAPP
jgi:hypothetical protein